MSKKTRKFSKKNLGKFQRISKILEKNSEKFQKIYGKILYQNLEEFQKNF